MAPPTDDDVRALQEIVESDGLPRVLARRAIRAWQSISGVTGAVNAVDVLKEIPPPLASVIRRGQWGAMATVLERLAQSMQGSGPAGEGAAKSFELVRLAVEDSRASAAVVQSHYARVSEARREEVAVATGRPIPNIRAVDSKNLTNAPDGRSGLAGLAQPKSNKRGT